MGFEAIRDTIEKRFAANWTTTPIKWENVEFIQPDRHASTAAWVSLVIRGNTAGGRISIGAVTPMRRFPYTIINQIFVPEFTGTSTIRTYADTISTIWRDVSVTVGSTGRIRFFDPNTLEIGPDNAGWYQLNVVTDFQYDDTF